MIISRQVSRSQCKAFSSEIPVGDPFSGPVGKFGVARSSKYQDPITAMFAAEATLTAVESAALIEAGTVGTAGLAMETAALTAATPTLFTAANMQFAGNAISAFSSFAQGSAQADYYRLQAGQAELQGRQNALNYNRQAYQLLERQERLRGTLIARAVAGGVDPLSGSPMTVAQSNAYRAGNEMQILEENAQLAISGGLAQSQSLRYAAATSEETGWLTGAGKGLLAGAAYKGVKIPSMTA
jgi:hypothetical protein